MEISKRLKAIGDMVPNGTTVADVGADHGLLEKYLVKIKPEILILAIENKKGPFEQLCRNVKNLKQVTTSLSDGIDELTPEYKTVILAGMGGENIMNILSKHEDKLSKVENIICDAHSFIPKVRSYLASKNFQIDEEKIVVENDIYYVLIRFKKADSVVIYTDEQIEFGVKLTNDPLYKKYKEHELQELNSIKVKLEGLENCKDKYEEILDTIRRLENYGQN